MKPEDFYRWFNRDFWKVFKGRAFPIKVPGTPAERTRLLEEVYESIRSARYAPSIPEAEIIINKGHGVARTVPVFCIQDYCVYYFCIKELEDVLCVNRTKNTFGGWSLGGNLRRQENFEIECELTDYGRYSFNPYAWAQAFGEFSSLLFSQLDACNYSHVLQFDLANFYDSVRLDILERWVREEAHSKKGWIITLLFYFLNQWNRRNTGLHPQSVGLPQDVLADCSRILANYYLQKYDQYAEALCLKSGALYFRYADDSMILLNEPEKREGLLLLITRRLDRFGLRVNQKKVCLWEAAELEAHRCRAIQAIFAQKGDNQKPELVRKFVEAYLAIAKDDLSNTWNHGKPLLNRLLFADLESLPKHLFEKILVRLTADFYLLSVDLKKLERIQKLNSKRREPINLSARLEAMGERCVHNAFHYEVSAFARLSNDEPLKAFFEARLAAIEKMMNADEVAGHG